MFPLKKICLIGLILLMGFSLPAQTRRSSMISSPAKVHYAPNKKATPYILKIGKIEYIKDNIAYVFLTSSIPSRNVDVIVYSCDIKSAPSALLNFNEFNPIYYRSVYAMEITEGRASAGDIVYVKVIPQTDEEDSE